MHNDSMFMFGDKMSLKLCCTKIVFSINGSGSVESFINNVDKL